MALAAAGAPSVFERWPRFAMQLSATHSETRGDAGHVGVSTPNGRAATETMREQIPDFAELRLL